MDVAKWLISLGSVNIHANDEYAFRESCRNGHMDVAKWLISLGGVNIHANNEYAFRGACGNGHMDIAKWLFSLGANINKDIYCGNDDIREWINSLKN